MSKRVSSDSLENTQKKQKANEKMELATQEKVNNTFSIN